MVAPDSVKDLVNRSVDKVVDYGYDDNNKGKSLKEHAISLAKDLTPELEDAGLRAGKVIADKVKDKIESMVADNDIPIDGDGLKRFKKGSEEAKEHIARNRGLKKGFGIIRLAEQAIKPEKGSQAMRDKMAKLRSLRKKKGAGFFDDLASCFIHTGLPTLGHIAGEFVGGPAGGMAGEQLGNMAGDAIGEATGRGLRNNTHIPYSNLIHGVPRPVSKSIVKCNNEKQYVRNK